MQQFPLVLNGHHDKQIGHISLNEEFINKFTKHMQNNIERLNLSVEYRMNPEPQILTFSFSFGPKPRR